MCPQLSLTVAFKTAQSGGDSFSTLVGFIGFLLDPFNASSLTRFCVAIHSSCLKICFLCIHKKAKNKRNTIAIRIINEGASNGNSPSTINGLEVNGLASTTNEANAMANAVLPHASFIAVYLSSRFLSPVSAVLKYFSRFAGNL
jgi:hypothetical protein